MKLAYYITRRQFGKVLTPLKVHSARLPIGFGQFYGKLFLMRKYWKGKYRNLSFGITDWQSCRFPRSDAAGNFSDGVKSAAL